MEDIMSENGFTEGQKAIIEKIGFAVGAQIEKRLMESFSDAIKIHAGECPGRSVGKTALAIIGVMAAAIGATIAAACQTFFGKH